MMTSLASTHAGILPAYGRAASLVMQKLSDRRSDPAAFVISPS